MSEGVIVSIVGAVSAAVGAIVHALVERGHGAAAHESTSSRLLLQAQRSLADTMEDMQLLWEWNRRLMDHIYRGAPPPPPPAPAGLFIHTHGKEQ